MSDRPTVPPNPQPLAVLRARYAAAVRELLPAHAIARGEREPPSRNPRHVFDTEDGLRLIVSREDMRLIVSREDMPCDCVHFSASFTDPERAKREHGGTAENLLLWIVESWRAISDNYTQPATLVLVSPGGIPHFIVEPTPPDARGPAPRQAPARGSRAPH